MKWILGVFIIILSSVNVHAQIPYNASYMQEQKTFELNLKKDSTKWSEPKKAVVLTKYLSVLQILNLNTNAKSLKYHNRSFPSQPPGNNLLNLRQSMTCSKFFRIRP